MVLLNSMQRFEAAAISIRSSSNTFNNMVENGIDALNSLPNKIKQFEGYHELEAQLNGNTDFTSTLLMSNGKEDIISKHSKTKKNLKQINTYTVENKGPIPATTSFPASSAPSSSDGSSFPENIFYAKAILACFILVILAAFICPCHKT